ncbi:MAG: hypothetical protein QOH57_3687 [Mycobacterium sp.]|jgi:hypothetical protein|nr:hypothetical protein [Mycobacterium sp.]
MQSEEGDAPQVCFSLARTPIVSWPLDGRIVYGDALAEAT